MEKKITLVLPVEAINALLNVVGTRPLNEILALWSEIKQQAEKQLQEGPDGL